MSGLTEAERDSLTECQNCDHWANEHCDGGCLGSVEDGIGRDGDQCPCPFTPDDIRDDAIRRIKTAAVAEERERIAAAIEAMRSTMDLMPTSRDDTPVVWWYGYLDDAFDAARTQAARIARAGGSR